MNKSALSHNMIALALLALCAIGVVLGVVKLVKAPADIKSVQAEKAGFSKTLLSSSSDRLALIHLDGMIVEGEEDGGMFASQSPAARAKKLLYVAAKDPSVKGVLLRINSPGGTVGMSQELYNAVIAVRSEKPVVVSMGDVAASGGYYTAAAADKIVANPGTLTASIGVILQSMNLQKLMNDKLGIEAVTIKSGKFKDILSPYRPPSAEDRALLQHVIDTSYKQFLGAVLAGRTRGLEKPAEKAKREQSIRAVADGRVVVGEDALKVGLVDALGGEEEAKTLLQDLAAKRFGVRDPKQLMLQEYETPFDIWQVLGMSSASFLKPVKAQMGAQLGLVHTPSSLRYANQPLWLMETWQ